MIQLEPGDRGREARRLLSRGRSTSTRTSRSSTRRWRGPRSRSLGGPRDRRRVTPVAAARRWSRSGSCGRRRRVRAPARATSPSTTTRASRSSPARSGSTTSSTWRRSRRSRRCRRSTPTATARCSTAEGSQAWADARAPAWPRPHASGRRRCRVALVPVRHRRAHVRAGQGGLNDHCGSRGCLRSPTSDRGATIEYRGRQRRRHGSAGGRSRRPARTGEAVEGSSVPAESVSDALRSYPQDLLASPLHVTTMRASFAPGVSRPAPARAGREPADGRPGPASTRAVRRARRQPGHRAGPRSGSLLAVAFGAWHALLPGHGKTLMAAYMVAPKRGCGRRSAVGIGGRRDAHGVGAGVWGSWCSRSSRRSVRSRCTPGSGLLSGWWHRPGRLPAIGRLSAWSASHAAEAREHDHDHGTTARPCARACRPQPRLARRRVAHVEARDAWRSPWPEASCRRRAR